MKAKLLFLLKICFSAVLLYILVEDVHFAEIYSTVGYADRSILIIAFLLHVVGFTVSSAKWKVLLSAQHVDSKMPYLIKSYLVAIFFNHFMPSTIGGDSVRAYDSWKLGENKSKAFAVIFIDRFIGFITLILFVIIALLFFDSISLEIPGLTLWIILLSSFVTGILTFLYFPPMKLFEKIKAFNVNLVSKIIDKVLNMLAAFNQFKNKKKALSVAFFLSIILQANVIFYYYLISVALNFQISPIDFLIIIPLTLFIMMIPISVNGIGLRENAFAFFFSFYGIVNSQAIGFAWIEFGMLLVLGIIGGFVYLFRNLKLA